MTQTLSIQRSSPVVHQIDLTQDKDQYTEGSRLSNIIARGLHAFGMWCTSPGEEVLYQVATVIKTAEAIEKEQDADPSVAKKKDRGLGLRLQLWGKRVVKNLTTSVPIRLASLAVLVPLSLAFGIVGVPSRAAGAYLGERTFAYKKLQKSSSCQTPKKSISFATFNTALGPSVMGAANGFKLRATERAKILGEQLAKEDVDVLSLQEAFDIDAQKVLFESYKKALQKRGYRGELYVIYDVLPNKRVGIGSGLMMISKLPFVGEVHCFSHLTDHSRAKKGSMIATVEVAPFKRVIIANTHLLGGTIQPSEQYPAGSASVRQEQIDHLAKQVKNYVKKAKAFQNRDGFKVVAVMAAGDFNMGPSTNAAITHQDNTREKNLEWNGRFVRKKDQEGRAIIRGHRKPDGTRYTNADLRKNRHSRNKGAIHSFFDKEKSTLRYAEMYQVESYRQGTDFPARDHHTDSTRKPKNKFLDQIGLVHRRLRRHIRLPKTLTLSSPTIVQASTDDPDKLHSDHGMVKVRLSGF